MVFLFFVFHGDPPIRCVFSFSFGERGKWGKGKNECLITGYFTVVGPPINYLQNLCFDVCQFVYFDQLNHTVNRVSFSEKIMTCPYAMTFALIMLVE